MNIFVYSGPRALRRPGLFLYFLVIAVEHIHLNAIFAKKNIGGRMYDYGSFCGKKAIQGFG